MIRSLVALLSIDELELGPRAATGLRIENRGLLRQRLEAIRDRRYRNLGWSLSYGPDGMCSSMGWLGCGGAPW